MTLSAVIWLSLAGLVSGVLAGFLGIGGGTLLVPVLVQLGFIPVQATATSSLAILVTSSAGSFQNWRMGYLNFEQIVLLGIPAVVTAFLGTFVGDLIAPHVLLVGFGLLLLSNLYLVSLKKRVVQKARFRDPRMGTGPAINPVLARLITGSTAGFMAGLFGVGGGVILVPLQILLLGESIKSAVRTSLGVIVITSVAACIGHALNQNINWSAGLILGLGGLMGVQVSTRFLPKLSDQTVTKLFRIMLMVLSVYIFWQAFQSWKGS
ncbi:MAG: sulfite exporter TauE/SafE family protein [Phormidesmis sp. RL_2_1]|nr:sulfite exporter TauE/SafE family protein [Phormidesmis sp. RL_2_1]